LLTCHSPGRFRNESGCSAHDNLIAGLQLDVLIHILSGDDFFVVKVKAGTAAPDDHDFLLVGEFPESTRVSESLEHGSGYQQRIGARLVNLSLDEVFLAVYGNDAHSHFRLLDIL